MPQLRYVSLSYEAGDSSKHPDDPHNVKHHQILHKHGVLCVTARKNIDGTPELSRYLEANLRSGLYASRNVSYRLPEVCLKQLYNKTV